MLSYTPATFIMEGMDNLITSENIQNILNDIQNGCKIEDPVVESLSIIMEDYLQDVLLNAYQMCRHRYSKVITPQDVWHYLNITNSSPIEPLAGIGATMGLGAVLSLISSSEIKNKTDKTKSMVNYLQVPKSNLSYTLNRSEVGRNYRKITSMATKQGRILSSYFSDTEVDKSEEITKHKIRSRNIAYSQDSSSQSDSMQIFSYASDS